MCKCANMPRARQNVTAILISLYNNKKQDDFHNILNPRIFSRDPKNYESHPAIIVCCGLVRLLDDYFLHFVTTHYYIYARRKLGHLSVLSDSRNEPPVGGVDFLA